VKVTGGWTDGCVGRAQRGTVSRHGDGESGGHDAGGGRDVPVRGAVPCVVGRNLVAVVGGQKCVLAGRFFAPFVVLYVLGWFGFLL
jgi:hypothetical protein